MATRGISGKTFLMLKDRWCLVAMAGLVVLMASVDQSIVTIALPAIGKDFHTTAGVTEWIVLGYTLPLVALALPSGRWLDLVGQRAALTLSVSGFGISSLGAGLAPGIGWLVLARVAQGAFGAVVLALIPAVITTAARPGMRGRAMGVVTTMGTLGLVSGPTLGGLLTASLGWRWVFYVNLPVSLLVLGAGRAQLPAGQPLRAPDGAWAAAAGLIGAAATAVLLGLSLTASDGLGWLPLTLVAVPLLLAWLRMPQSAPVRALARVRGVVGPHIGLAGTATATGVVFFLMPFYLIQVLHVSVRAAGLVVLAFPLGMLVGGPAGGLLADWWGTRRSAVTGAALFAAGLALAVPLGGSWGPADLAWRLAIAGAGVGMFNAPNMTTAMSNAPRRLLGTTGASTSVARQAGFAIGPAMATLVWAASGFTLAGMRGAVGFAALLAGIAAAALWRTPPADRSAPVTRAIAPSARKHPDHALAGPCDTGAHPARRTGPSQGEIP
jgi:MFS family permease